MFLYKLSPVEPRELWRAICICVIVSAALLFQPHSAPAADLAAVMPADGKNELYVSNTAGALAISQDVTVIALSAGYLRRFDQDFALGAEAEVVNVNADDYDGSAFSLFAIGHYVFDYREFRRSWFALAGMGFGSSSTRYLATADVDSKLALRGGIGKRIPLGTNLTLRPEVFLETGDSVSLVFRFLNLTYVW